MTVTCLHNIHVHVSIFQLFDAYEKLNHLHITVISLLFFFKQKLICTIHDADSNDEVATNINNK